MFSEKHTGLEPEEHAVEPFEKLQRGGRNVGYSCELIPTVKL